MADATGGSKELGLGVIFTATIAGFAEQLTAIQNQLKNFASQLEQFGKTGEKAMEGLAKATTKIDKASADAAKTAKEAADKQAASSTASAKASEGLAASTEKATVAAKSHGQSLSAVRESMKGLDAATQSQIASSKMSLPVYEALQKRLAANSSEAGGFKKALASLAMEPGQTALGFNNLTSALIKNEKAMLESKSSIGNLRDQLSGSNNLPSNVKNWSSSINRAEMAHATLNKELYKSGDVVQQAGKTIAETTRSLTALEKQYGADNVSKYREQIGSTIKTMGEFKSALVANQTAQIAANTHTIAAEKAITATQTALNAMNGSGDAWRKGVNESAVATQFLRGRLADANGQILQSGKAFMETSQAVDKMGASFSKSLSSETINTIRGQIGQTIGTLNEYQQALARASNRGDEISKANARAGEAFRELGINSAASGKAIAFVADQVAKGNMTYESASRVIKNHSDAIIKADKAATTLSEGQSRLSASFGSLMARTDEYGAKAKSLYDNFTNGNKNLADTRILMQGVNVDYQKSVTATTSLIDASTNLNSKYRELLSTTNTYNGTAARQMISNLQNGGTEAKVLGDTFQRMNQDLKEHTASVNKWNETIKNIPASNIAATAEVNRLQAAVNSGNMSYKQATESINNFTKSIDNKTKAVKSSGDSFRAFASGIIGGGAAANVAAGYFTNLAVAVRSLAAWIPAAMIIGAFTEAITGAVKGVKEFDQALKNLQAISQGTDAEVALLGDEMIKLSNNTKYSATEISKGAIFIAQAGFTAGETLQVIGAAAKLAQGSLSDMSMSADLLTTVLRVFHIEGREAANVADMLAVAANKSKTDIQGLRIAFNYLGPVAQATGMSLQEALASIMALANAGIRMSTVGTGMRQILSRLENPTMKLKMAMDEAGLSTKDFSFKTYTLGTVAENMAKIIQGSAGNALKFFGERAGNQALIISNLGEKMDVLVGYLGELGAANAMAAKQSEGLSVKLAILSNRFENMFIQMTSGTITDILKGIITGLTTLVDWLTVVTNNSFVKFLAVVAIVNTSVSLLVIVFRSLLALSLASWLDVSRASIVAMMNSMGLWQTVLTAILGSLYQFANIISSITALLPNTISALVALRTSFFTVVAAITSMVTQSQALVGIITALTTAFTFLSAIFKMAASLIIVLTANLWQYITAQMTVVTQSRIWIVATELLTVSLGALGTAIKGVIASTTFWLAALAALAVYFIGSSNAKEKEILLLQKQTLKYQESVEVLKGYAKELTSLGESQAAGNDVSLQNLALLQKIKAAYPELNKELFKSTSSIKEQTEAVLKLSAAYDVKAIESARVTTEKIVISMQEGAKAAKIYQNALDSNKTVWQALGVSVLQTYKIFTDNTTWWMNTKLAFSLLMDGAMGTKDAVTMLSDGIIKANASQFSSYTELASFLTNASPKIQADILATLPSDLARERVAALIATNLEYQNMLKLRSDYSNELANVQKKNIESLGEDWISYFQQQDAAGMQVVANAAIRAQALIEIEQKKFMRSKQTVDDKIARDKAVQEIKVSQLNALVEYRTKQVDQMLALMDKYYKNEEKGIKTSYENQLTASKLAETLEIAALDVRLLGQTRYQEAKSKIEQFYIDKNKLLVDAEAAASIEAANRALERQKIFLGQQTSLKEGSVNDANSRIAIAEQVHADKLVEIYKIQLGHYKTMITAKLAEVERHKAAALKAEDDISAAQLAGSEKVKSLEEQKRKALQLTMTAREKEKDDVLQFSKLMTLGDAELSNSRIAKSDAEKKAKLALAKEYYEQAQSLNTSLTVSDSDSSKKVVKDDEDTKNLRIANINLLKTAFSNLTDQTIANADSRKTAEIDGAKDAQKAVNDLLNSYNEVTGKLEKAVEIQIDNDKAVQAMTTLAEAISGFNSSDKSKVVVRIKATGSEEKDISEKIADVVTMIDEFATDVKAKTFDYVVRFMGTLDGSNTNEFTFSQIFEKITTSLSALKTDIAKLAPEFLIKIMGNAGGSVETFVVILEYVKQQLAGLVIHIAKNIIGLFTILTNVDALVSEVTAELSGLKTTIERMQPVYTITTRYVSSGSAPGTDEWGYTPDQYSGGDYGAGVSDGSGPGFASGGSIPGTGNSDTVPAMLTPGEFVINKATVQSLGTGFFQFINGIKNFAKGGLVQHFASGGVVQNFADGGTVTTSALTYASNIEGSLKSLVGRIDSMEAKLKVTTTADSAVTAAQVTLSNFNRWVKNNPAKYFVQMLNNEVSSRIYAAMAGYASGGSVPGAGSGDTVPAMLTPGEFVVNKGTVSALGEGFFSFINSMKSFSVPKFNTGGLAFANGGSVPNSSGEIFTINLQAGAEKLPLQVIGNPDTMRNMIRSFEKELSKMRLSHV